MSAPSSDKVDIEALEALAAQWRMSAASLAVEAGDHGYDSTDDMVNDEIAAVYAEVAGELERLIGS